MLRLSNLQSICKKRKRVGRGGDCGGTSGRGHKGQKARTGSSGEIKPCFEGGQMPLSRRLPKRGFNNPFKQEVKGINLSTLENFFSADERVDESSLRQKGIIKGKRKFLVKILGKGELTKKLNVCADAFSKSAIEAIEKNGGKAELVKEL
jgi:large subunit ribosomal protein L15